MNKFSKPILICLAVIIGILLCALLGINLYLQSKAVQNKIQKGVEDALGMKLTLGGTSYTPWSGLKLSAVSLADPQTPQDPFAKVGAIRFDISPWPLLQKKIRITSVTLDKPIVELKEGHPLRLPSPSQKGGSGKVEGGSEGNIPPSAPNPQVSQSPSLPVPSSPVPQPPSTEGNYEVEVKKILIKNGSITVTNESGHPILNCKNLNATAHIASEWALRGEASADEIVLGNRLFVRPIHLHFHRTIGNIIIDPISGKLADGEIKGALDIEEATRRFEHHLQFNSVSIPELLVEAGFAESNAAGTIDGSLVLRGKTDDKASYTGESEIHLLNAKLEPYNFLKKLGQLLKIDELQLLDLRQANAHMQIKQAKVFLDKLFMQSENLIIESTGAIDFNGDLDLNANLLVNEKLQRNLGSLLGKNFTDSNQEGYKQMGFHVSGNIKKPKTDLLEKITGLRLGNNLGSLLQNLLSAPPKTTSD